MQHFYEASKWLVGLHGIFGDWFSEIMSNIIRPKLSIRRRKIILCKVLHDQHLHLNHLNLFFDI